MKYRFSYGQGMQKQWIESNSIFIDLVASKYEQSIRSSLESGEVIVTEVDKSVLIKFDTKEEMKAHIASLKYWQQE